jgi:hypothetical protein
MISILADALKTTWSTLGSFKRVTPNRSGPIRLRFQLNRSMDSDSLSFMADLMAAATGTCLTVEQKAYLPSSLAILKNQHGFSRYYYAVLVFNFCDLTAECCFYGRVLFWGKIHGQQADYLIAQAKYPCLPS